MRRAPLRMNPSFTGWDSQAMCGWRSLKMTIAAQAIGWRSLKISIATPSSPPSRALGARGEGVRMEQKARHETTCALH
jgi:hypothetical protein